MKTPLLKIAGGIAMLVGLMSCGTMDTLKTSTASSMDKVGQGFGKVGEGFGKVGDLAMSPFRPGVPVVEAREQDLKDLPSGQEQALAYQRQNTGFWGFFGGPQFEEPSLPEDGGAMDGGLLPPLE